MKRAMWPSVSNEHRTLLVIGTLLLLAVLLVSSCATVKPHMWEMCRDACARNGGQVAAIVGSTQPLPEEHPACLCHSSGQENGGT